MNIRFYNCKILPMIDGYDIFDGEVWTEGKKIKFAGSRAEADKEEKILFDREIDCKGNLIMPGFKNAHTHSAMTFLRSYADDMSLQDWLYKQVFPMEAKLTGEDAYWLSTLAIMEYLTSGITSNFDMYMYMEDCAKASVDTGFRTVMCGSVNDFGGSADSIREENEKFSHYHELISYQVGFHAEYTTARPLMESIALLAQELRKPVFLHNSETKAEVEGCIERYKATPTVFLDSIGMFEYGGGGFHCVYTTDEDLEIMKKRNLSVVTNPGSNTKLASGICPVEKYVKAGITVGIGTDGPASNNCLDMFREMFLVTGLQKLSQENASAMDANEVLKMACSGGAKIMGLDDCDCIQKGKLADLIVIDLNRPNMQPLNNISKNIVYSGSKENVKLTMINGEIKYENGEFFIGVSPQEVYRKVNEIIASKKNA